MINKTHLIRGDEMTFCVLESLDLGNFRNPETYDSLLLKIT